MAEQTVIAVTNNYPTDKYNLLIPVKSMQELSPMHKIIVNEVQIDPDYNKGSDVYVQTKGYNDTPDKLALTKTALSKLMTAAGINMVESKAIIPSTHLTAIEMAKAIGKIVPYDTRDVAHEVTLMVPEPSGQYRPVKANKEIIVEDLKAEYLEQKKNMEVWENKKKRPATEKEKNAAVEKQLTQFLAHKRAQCETKALNRALREAMGIKSTYTADELQKPFIVAHVVPNLADPELKKAYISKYTQSSELLFGNRKEEVKAIAAPTTENAGNENNESNIVEGEIINDSHENEVFCEKCAQQIETIDEQWTADAIVEYSKNKFKGKIYCPDCQREVLAAFRKAKEGNK